MVLNSGTGAANINLALTGGFTPTVGKAYVVDSTRDLAEITATLGTAGVTASLPARSLVSFVLAAGNGTVRTWASR